MDLQNLDKETLKAALKEIMGDVDLKSVIKEVILEDVDFFREILTETLQRKEKVEELIDKNFDKYDDVFKALA